MAGGQVAVADYCPNWWPAATRLLIRRVRLDVAHGAVSADPRARRRRTLRPEQRALPLAELDELDAVYGYSFIVTNLDVATGERAAAVEHWYRHRTSIPALRPDGLARERPTRRCSVRWRPGAISSTQRASVFAAPRPGRAQVMVRADAPTTTPVSAALRHVAGSQPAPDLPPCRSSVNATRSWPSRLRGPNTR